MILSKKRSLNLVSKFTCRTILFQDKNVIKGTVNVIKGTVNVIKGSVNVIKGTVNVIKGTVNVIKRTVNVIKGTINVIKGTENVISNDTQSNDGNARFTPVPLKTLNLIKNVDEAVVLLTRKLFTSVSFSIANYKQGEKPHK